MNGANSPSPQPQVVGRDNGTFALLNVDLEPLSSIQRLGIGIQIWDQVRTLMEAQGRYRPRDPKAVGSTGIGAATDIDNVVAELVHASASGMKAIRPRASGRPDVVERMVAGDLDSRKEVIRSLGKKVPLSFFEGGEKSEAKATQSGFGRSDKFDYAAGALLQYLRVWRKKDFRYSHVNPKEAQKRIRKIDEIMADLSAAREDLAKRSRVAAYAAPSERRENK